jgi:hypothetical protein
VANFSLLYFGIIQISWTAFSQSLNKYNNIVLCVYYSATLAKSQGSLNLVMIFFYNIRIQCIWSWGGFRVSLYSTMHSRFIASGQQYSMGCKLHFTLHAKKISFIESGHTLCMYRKFVCKAQKYMIQGKGTFKSWCKIHPNELEPVVLWSMRMIPIFQGSLNLVRIFNGGMVCTIKIKTNKKILALF